MERFRALPTVEPTYPSARAIEAERRQQDGHVHGKIVVQIAA